MLELYEIADVLSGVSIPKGSNRSACFIRLSDISDIKAGKVPKLARGEAPAVARAVSIKQGDIIVGARGFASGICLATSALFGAYISLDLYLVRPKIVRVNPQYLAAFLALPATQALFAGGKQGSSLARLPKEALERAKIPLPPIHVQKMIAELAAVFEQEDRLLKKLAILNSTLSHETISRAIHAGTEQISPGDSQ